MELLLWIAAIWVALNLAGAAAYLLGYLGILIYRLVTNPRATILDLKERYNAR
jgi:hypothetical protein